jgi:tyrosine-specific transport protein
MSYKLRSEAKAAARKLAYMTPGGNMGIATAAVCGVVILVANYV